MDDFVVTSEKMHPSGGTRYIYVMEEARALGLENEDTIGAVLFRPENKDDVMSLLYGSNPYLFYVVAGPAGNEVRKALSEVLLARSMDYEYSAILGPFESLSEARWFRDFLDEKGESDPGALKALFRDFVKD